MVSGLYGILMFAVLLSCLTRANVEYVRKTIPLLSEWKLLIGGMISWIICIYIGDKISKKFFAKHTKSLIWICSLSFFIFQAYLVKCYYFYTDWDVATLVEAAFQAASRGSMEEFNYYFSTYPNNLLMVSVWVQIIRFFGSFTSNPYYGILFVQCFISWGTGLCLFFILRKLVHSEMAALCGWGIYVILAGLSPWVSIPYSDSMALIFPAAILLIYLCQKEVSGWKQVILWILMGMLAIIGYEIKPQVAIILIAIIIVEFVHLMQSFSKRISLFGGLVIGILVGFMVISMCSASLDVEIDHDRTNGWTHFFMMGMNYGESNGVWNKEDTEISDDCDTYKERCEVNLEVAQERIQEMGVSGFADLMHRKLLTNYNDGTFCWSGEEDFFIKLISTSESGFAKFVRDVYYCREWQGKYYDIFYVLELTVWLTTLFFGMVGAFFEKRNRDLIVVAMLAIIGLTIFEQIFEARSRYLYIYVPIYILLAINGMSVLKVEICKRQIKIRQ